MPGEDRFDRLWRAFHNHIEACARCSKQIFNLCPVGDVLIRAAAEAGAERLEAMGIPFRTASGDAMPEGGGPHAG